MSKAKSEKIAWTAIKKIEKKIRAKLNDHIFACDDETLEGVVGGLLAKKRLTISVAESCTGGLLSSRITDVSGSSKYFPMGLVAYSNQVKVARLGVDEKVLMKYGAVSKEVACQMASGIKFLAGTDVGIGITGIAGPDGAAKNKPVGLVYIALDIKGRPPFVREFRFRGFREEIKFQATQTALNLLRRNILCELL
jgi:nicotinamide-nucleotide amidase